MDYKKEAKVFPYNNFNSARCNICFIQAKNAINVKLKYCSNCKLIGYCSQLHQKQDWKYHKDLCANVTSIIKSRDLNHILEIKQDQIINCAKQEIQSAIYVSKCILLSVVKRPLYMHEQKLLTFPNICRICFEYDQSKLLPCKNCHQIFYCSDSHRERDEVKHRLWCSQYKINFLLDNECPLMECTNDKVVPKLTKKELQKFPSNSFTLVNLILKTSIPVLPETPKDYENLKLVSMYSYVGTILYALSVTHFMDMLEKTFVIHIIGARDEIIFFERNIVVLLFSYLENVSNIKIHFIGPELNSITSHLEIKYVGNKSIKMQFHNSLYNDIHKSEIEPPHLIISYNCGFSEYQDGKNSPRDTWMPAILKMIKCRNIPIVFTSYTRHESIQDCAVVFRVAKMISKEDFVYVIKSEQNPFKDYKPIRNQEYVDEIDELYFSNGYITIIVSQFTKSRKIEKIENPFNFSIEFTK